jgi:hypothetical protein
MTPISQQIGLTEFPIIIKTKLGKTAYHENSDGFWYIKKYDEEGNETECMTSTGEHKKSLLKH